MLSLSNHRKNNIYIALAAITVYFNCLQNGFVWDDLLLIINNDFSKGFGLIRYVFTKPLYYLINPDYQYYRPVQAISNIIDYKLWGLNPFGFHLTNLLLHIICAGLVYHLLNLLFFSPKTAFFASLFFAVHPINTSTVAYISGRADIPLVLFCVLSLITFLKSHFFWQYALSFLFFVLAVFSKETALIFPVFLIITCEIYLSMAAPNKNEVLKKRLHYLFFPLFCVLYLFIRRSIPGLSAEIIPGWGLDFLSVCLTMAKAVLIYLRLLVLPFNLHMLRTTSIVSSFSAFYFITALLLVISVLFSWKAGKKFLFSLGIFLVWVAPIAVLAFRNPEYFLQGKAIIEEHWLYPAGLGFFIILAAIFSFFSRKMISKILLCIFVGYLGFFTIKNNFFWKDNHSLFSHTLKYVKNSVTVYRNMARMSLNNNEPKNAVDLYSAALLLKQSPKSKSVLYKDLGYAYFVTGRIDDAQEAFKRSVEIDGRRSDSYAYLGIISFNKGQADKALDYWKKSLAIDPFNSVAYSGLKDFAANNGLAKDYLLKAAEDSIKGEPGFMVYKVYFYLGAYYLFNNSKELAFNNLNMAYKINPYNAKINCALAVYYSNVQDTLLASRFFDSALRLNPFDGEIARNAAIFYNSIGSGARAAQLTSRANTVDILNSKSYKIEIQRYKYVK